MKSLNDIELIGVMGTPPSKSAVPSNRTERRTETRVHFPVVWTQSGVTSLITVTAIGRSADTLLQHALPGEPLFITGTLTKYHDMIRCKMVSSARYPTNLPTIEHETDRGRLLSLDGGEAVVRLRGHVHEDSRVVHGRFHTALSVRDKDGAYAEHFTVVTDMPLFGGQGVSVEGDYTRYSNEDETSGLIVARRVRVSERLTGAANMTGRDPQDRLRLHRLGEADRQKLSSQASGGS